jgi:hypothetical protein
MRDLLILVIVVLALVGASTLLSAIVLAAGWILSLIFPVSIAEAALLVVATAVALVWILKKTLVPSLREATGNLIEEDAVEAEDVVYTKDGTPICPQCGRELTPVGPARWTHREAGDEDVAAGAPVAARKKTKRGRR